MSSLGKQKGAAFEREICKRLSLWVSEGKREDVFWRSAMSGGRATLLARSGKQAALGDVSAVHALGHTLINHVHIECKFYQNLGVESFFYRQGGKLEAFRVELCNQEKTSGKLTWLIAKQNRRPTLVVSSGTMGVYLRRLGTSFWEFKGLGPSNPLVVFQFDDLLADRYALFINYCGW